MRAIGFSIRRDFVAIQRRVGKPLDRYCLYPIRP
jgi:hypothetical protein